MRRIRVGITGSATLLSSVLLLAACGGGGDGGGGSPTPDAAVGGLWAGSIVISGQGAHLLLGIVAEDGRAYFLQEDGVMYWGTVSSTGNQVTSSLQGAGLFGMPLWDGSASGTGSVAGTIRARASISANSSFTTALGGSTTASISLDYDPLYNDDASLSLIAGNYLDVLGLYSGVLNIASNGGLFLQDPASGCVINGQIAVIEAAYNAYDVEFSYSNCVGFDAYLNGATFSGLATYDQNFEELVALVQGSVGGVAYPNVLEFERQ